MILKKNFKKCMGIGDGEDSGRCLLNIAVTKLCNSKMYTKDVCRYEWNKNINRMLLLCRHLEKWNYIDKGDLVREFLIAEWRLVTLITWSRGYMKLFTCLSILENKNLCDNWVNQYTTVFL